MMAVRRYTLEELHKLRESPLVQKPDNLPAIEQWIDESQKQQQQQRQSRPAHTGDASPMGNFSAGQQRPGLIGARSGTGSRAGDDVPLGPPRTVFASSRSITRLSDLQPDHTSTEDGEGSRKLGADRQANRKSGTQEAEGRFSRDSWTSAREKRLANADEETGDRARFGRRDRDKDQEGDRRNGFSDRQDPRWARDGGRTNGDRAGGWRGRDKPRQERDWDRSGGQDKEPEWMDDPAPKDEVDLGSMGMPKNQEDFEKWKQAQHARNKKHTEEPAKVEEAPPAAAPEPPKPAATLKLDTLPTQSFHEWGKRITSEGTPDSAGTPAKSAAPTKAKASRFMPMFKKDEVKQEPPLASPPLQNPNGSAEDKEGFQRILQMLGGTSISQNPTPVQSQPPSQPPSQSQSQPFEPASPQARQVSGGSKPKSRFTGFFDQIPKSPETVQSPPAFPPEQNRPFSQEPGNVYGARQHEHQPSISGIAPPEPPTSASGFRDHRPQSGSLNGLFLDKPPSRGAATPDINIKNLLASQRQRPQGPDKNSEFLLNLLQTKGSSRPSSQQTAPETNFPLWLDQPRNATEPHAPIPRMPAPPGHFEDQLLRNVQGGPPRPPQQQGPNEMLQRRTSQQRAGPGFMDEQLFLQQQQQRRNFPEQQAPPNRRVQPNMGPQMQLNPPFQYPPEFLQSTHAQAPPPGFNPHMPRHPPGIHNGPNIFQAPQAQRDQQQQQPPPPQPPPPGFGGPNGPPAPGFFAGPPPPGFMQMRSPTGGGRGF